VVVLVPRNFATSAAAISWSGRPFFIIGEAAGREAQGNGDVASGRGWVWDRETYVVKSNAREKAERRRREGGEKTS